jgi:hypothetical protein
MTLALVDDSQIIGIDGINTEWLEEWIDYRRTDCKKPMSDRAIRMVTKKLLQWNQATQERLICYAIEMEWKGIYWVEPPKQRSSRQTAIIDDLTDTSWAT